MNSILINYSLSKDINKNRLQTLLNGCQSDKYKVFLNIYDFSISKNVKEKLDQVNIPKNIKISVENSDYENLENYIEIVSKTILQYSDSVSYCRLNETISLEPKSIDEIDFSVFDDGNYGFLYFDYDINSIRCFIKSYGHNGSVPAIFFSAKKTLEKLSNGKPITSILSESIGLHIPERLCTIYSNDEK